MEIYSLDTFKIFGKNLKLVIHVTKQEIHQIGGFEQYYVMFLVRALLCATSAVDVDVWECPQVSLRDHAFDLYSKKHPYYVHY